MRKKLLIGLVGIGCLVGVSVGVVGCGEPEDPYSCNETVLSVYGESPVDCAQNAQGYVDCSCDPERVAAVSGGFTDLCACVPPLID